jgi:hypothetical protein
VKLTIYQSDKGDCLLLEATSGELVLCDGGMGTSMKKQVRKELAKLRTQGRSLELAYISHIDADHINGVLQLLDDEVQWRVYEHHKQLNDTTKRPSFPRPPVIKGILHNGFRDQLKDNTGALKNLITAREIENLLTASAPALAGTGVPALLEMAEDMAAIANGIPESLKVARLSAPDALDIPINKPPGVSKPSRLLFAGQPGDRFSIGSMDFTLIGPTSKELQMLRKGWNNFLRTKGDQIKRLQAELKKRIEEFSTGTRTESPFDLGDWEGIPDVEGVTVPNVASLVFVVEEDGKTLLLTGDAQQDIILDGLKRTGYLDGDDGHLHLDCLKVQHHGSEHNMDDNFAERVSADHYVFCGNGMHDNPDLEVLNMVFRSRQNDDEKYHFWFSTTSEAQEVGSARRKYFEDVEAHVEQLKAESDGRLTLHFNRRVGTALRI